MAIDTPESSESHDPISREDRDFEDRIAYPEAYRYAGLTPPSRQLPKRVHRTTTEAELIQNALRREAHSYFSATSFREIETWYKILTEDMKDVTKLSADNQIKLAIEKIEAWQQFLDEPKADAMGRAILPLLFRDIVHQTENHIWMTIIADAVLLSMRESPYPPLESLDSFREFQEHVIKRAVDFKHFPKQILAGTDFEHLMPS